MKLSQVNQYTIPHMSSEALEDAQRRTRDVKKRSLIQKELDSRKALKVNRPLSIEDFLG